MFESHRPRTAAGGAAGLLERIYHATVRDVRKAHGNALMGLLISIVQNILMVAVFWVMFVILGMRGSALRGDFVLYLMSGIFLFMTHVKALGAVAKAEGPSSAMMKHGPMNTVISISAAALSALYLQVLSMVVILYLYHALVTPITIDQPVGAMGMFLISWLAGVAVGMIFLALRPWNPQVVGIVQSLYTRANMVASGKMFVANQMPTKMLALFDWNPLFHTIDQTRGYAFLNYSPHYSSVSYPVYVTLALLTIGMMGEFYTRQRASASWDAAR